MGGAEIGCCSRAPEKSVSTQPGWWRSRLCVPALTAMKRVVNVCSELPLIRLRSPKGFARSGSPPRLRLMKNRFVRKR